MCLRTITSPACFRQVDHVALGYETEHRVEAALQFGDLASKLQHLSVDLLASGRPFCGDGFAHSPSDSVEQLRALDVEMASEPFLPSLGPIGLAFGLRGGRRCVFDGLEYQTMVGLRFSHR